jgi:hypothetical protein
MQLNQTTSSARPHGRMPRGTVTLEDNQMIRAATERGDKYVTLRGPCQRGHIAPRFVSSTQCTECIKVRKAERSAHPDRLAYLADKAARPAERRKCAVRAPPWAAFASTLEEAWARGRANARTALDRPEPGQTPAWADFDEIEAIYICAAIKAFQMRAPYDVDHIQPLKGKDRSGLHVQGNLQILPRSANLRKGNRVSPPA